MEKIRLAFYEVGGYEDNLKKTRSYYVFPAGVGMEFIAIADSLSGVLHVSPWVFIVSGILMIIVSVYLMTRYMFPERLCRELGAVELREAGITYYHSDTGKEEFVSIESLDNVKLRLLLSSRFIYRRHIYVLQLENAEYKVRGLLIFRNGERPGLATVLEKWYLQNKRVYEFNNRGERTFLLRRNYTYAEIQELKKKYGLEWVVQPGG